MILDLFGIEKIGLFELKEGWVVFIEALQDLGHNGFPHKLGFVTDLVFFAVEVNGILFPAIKQQRGSVCPSKFFIFFIIVHLS